MHQFQRSNCDEKNFFQLRIPENNNTEVDEEKSASGKASQTSKERWRATLSKVSAVHIYGHGTVPRTAFYTLACISTPVMTTDVNIVFCTLAHTSTPVLTTGINTIHGQFS